MASHENSQEGDGKTGYTEQSTIIDAANRSDQKSDSVEPSPMYRKRYLLAFMFFLGFFNIYCLRVSFSVAIVAMTNKHGNRSSPQNDVFDWDTGSQGLLLSAFFYGYICTQLVGGFLSNRLGGKWIYGGAVTMDAILTMLTPMAAELHYDILVVVRVSMGMIEGLTYPCMFAMWRNWAPSQERSKLVTIANSGCFIGTVVSMPASSIIGEYFGWPSIFYAFGTLSLMWSVAWFALTSERPTDSPGITIEELRYIQLSTGKEPIEPSLPPFRHVITCMPLWAMAVAHFVDHWCVLTMLTELPTFLCDILEFDLQNVGLIAAVPYLAMAVTVQSGGHFADLLRCRGILSTTVTRKLFVCLPFLCSAAFMVATAYSRDPIITVIFVTLCVGFEGFTHAGFLVVPLDIAPQYASILFGFSNTISTVAGIVTPSLTGFVVHDKTVDEWRVVFFVAAAIYVVGAVFYGVFGSGKLQPWAEESCVDYKLDLSSRGTDIQN